jgi:eukaryotic-like serine/threonine-protein kinase
MRSILPMTMTESLDPLTGTPYRIIGRVGEGGMGEVYEVQHVVLGRVMIAKILRESLASDRGLIDRMRVEAQALGALSHPNIVEVVHFDWTRDGRPYFVMEKLHGRTLGDELRARGCVPPGEAIEITCQALAGLEAAHQIGLVHRDIKLENLFLHSPGEGRRVLKILDFGITKVLGGAERGPAPPILPTADGAIVGTPRYVSPEQVLGRPIDGRADLYAIGLVLYAVVAGRGPFDHIRGSDLFDAHVRLEPDPPSSHAPQPLAAELDAVILRALSKDPADRFQRAAELAHALDRIARTLSSPVGWLATTPAAALTGPTTPPALPTAGVSSLAIPTTPVDAMAIPTPQAAADALPTVGAAPMAIGGAASASGSPAQDQTLVLPEDPPLPEEGLPTRTAVPLHASTPAPPLPAGVAGASAKSSRAWPAYFAIAAAATATAIVALLIVGTGSPLALTSVLIAGLAGATVVAVLNQRFGA